MTTRRLVLVRHAKAVTGDGDDGDRPLADRGVRDSPAIGRQLADWVVVPDRVVVSPARRAKQTWELAARQLTGAPDPVFDERVYRNTVDDLSAVVRSTPEDVDTLAVVGHNPSIEEFGLALDNGKGEARARQTAADGYPTSAIAVFGIDVDWSQVAEGTGTLTAFAAPRG
jgi:phosphohistidine phosphatase